MNVSDTIRARRSIRTYRDDDVPDAVIKELLDLAIHAPSSMNGQPWVFIAVRNDRTKARLAEIKNRFCPVEKQVYQADFIRRAPVILLVCVDRERSFEREVENAVLATANIMLGAVQKGLGSVYMSAYRPNDPRISEEIKALLEIPEHIAPITLIPLGYPNETPEHKTLKSLDEAIFYEAFGKKQP
jgi:nitroreductase